MKIAIDARWIFPELSGIGTYTLELIRQLVHSDRSNEYVILFQHPELLERISGLARMDEAPHTQTVQVPYGVFSIVGQLRLPGVLRRLGIDVYHSPNFMIPLPAFPRNRKGRIRCVTTVHDLIPLLFPEFAPRSKKSRLFPLYRRLMREVALRSHLILTDSANSQRDILRAMDLPEERVLSIPIGVSPDFTPASGHHEGPLTLLYVGRMDPYKNVAGVIHVLERVRKLSGLDVRLTIIGPPDARYPSPTDIARSMGVQQHLHWAGYLPMEDLLKTYRQSRALLLLSQYEGFGLPVLEAMACGTPVICSNTSSLPEVAGSAALLVDPDDVEGAACAVTRILTDPKLADDLREKGLRQASLFTWKRTAEQTLKAYERALSLA